jgi:general secretion pathway protein D
VKRPGLILALALLATTSAVAQTQMINLRDADIRAFIQDVSRSTGRSFIIDPRVQGKVSVVTDRPLGREQYFELFLSTLRANNLVAIPTGNGAYRIQPSEGAATQAPAQRSGGNRFVTEVIRLGTIDAASAVETLRPLVSKDGQLTPNRTGNTVVVADYADNVARIRSLAAQIDRDRSAVRIVPLTNAGAREIASALGTLATAASGGAEGPRAGGGVSIVPIDSSNAVVLRGDPAAVSRMVDIVQDLDRRAARGTDVRVIQLQHADAAKLLPVLQQIAGQVAPAAAAPTAAAAAGGEGAAPPPAVPAASPNGAVIARYEGANAIIISAPSDMQRILEKVVSQLDTRREQVLVEAIIVEISDTAAKRLGVQFLLGGLPGSGVPFAVTNYSNSAPNLLAIAGAVGARELGRTTTTINGATVTTSTNSATGDALEQAAVSSLLNAAGGFGGFAGKLGGNAIFATIINAVKSDNTSNILSTPSIMTLDNQEAKILVGQEIPVTTGEALSDNFDNAFRTVQRQNVGIQLEVKPQINQGGAIKLFLRQEVSSIAGPVSADFNDLILNKREIETTVTVDDGQIIALGGLLDENERRTLEKIPLLGDIPGIGQLFRSRARERAKTNLMVFIRPTIVRSAADARAITDRRFDYTRNDLLMRRPEQEPGLDALVRDYMGAPPPGTIVPPPPPASPR